jgi:glycosyltransferase involved in cell wall biosynthesis
MASKDAVSAWLPAGIDACALWRLFIPHLNIAKSKFIYKPNFAVPMESFAEADVAVVQRQVTINNYAAILLMKDFGIKVVYDIDDNLWEVPIHNPGHDVFMQHRVGFGECAKICDVVTVSTSSLKEAILRNVPSLKVDVVVMPNAVDFKLFQNCRVERNPDEVVIGWAGSNTHMYDVPPAWAALSEIVLQYPNVFLEILGGADPPPKLKGHPRVRYRSWVPVGEYAPRFASWGWDIVLAPLGDNPFNRSKSNIKVLEAAAIGAAALASDVRPYREFCERGTTELKWLLCSYDKWKRKLRELVCDRGRRLELASQMRVTAEQSFSIDVVKEQWKGLFRRVCFS